MPDTRSSMSPEELTHALTRLRDEAHSLSKEKLATGTPDAARLEHAQAIDKELDELAPTIEAEAAADRARHNDIVQVARRYLIFLLQEAETAQPATVHERAQSLHNEVIATAKLVAAGTLTGAARDSRVAALAAQFETLLADPARTGDEAAQRILADINLDLGFIRADGKAPTSLRLGRELRP